MKRHNGEKILLGLENIIFVLATKLTLQTLLFINVGTTRTILYIIDAIL